MAASNDSSVSPPDFSEPWKFSDVVLVVEEQKFHVHRSTLSMWSPVFETMFKSKFKERNMNEIPLPGKKASEIAELLLIIYPTVPQRGWRSVTNENCYFLVVLAEEYQMDAIKQKCEDFLVQGVHHTSGNKFLDHLSLAQTHKLEKLVKTIITKATELQLDDLKSHEMYNKMEPDIYKQILEGMIRKLEGKPRIIPAEQRFQGAPLFAFTAPRLPSDFKL